MHMHVRDGEREREEREKREREEREKRERREREEREKREKTKRERDTQTPRMPRNSARSPRAPGAPPRVGPMGRCAAPLARPLAAPLSRASGQPPDALTRRIEQTGHREALEGGATSVGGRLGKGEVRRQGWADQTFKTV